MIQDIYPKIYHNEYYDIKPDVNDFILVFFKNTALIRFHEGKLRYPVFKELQTFSCDYYYLFSIDRYRYFLACPKVSQEMIQIDGYHYEDISIFRTALSRHTSFAGITAHHLFNLYHSG